MEASFRPSGERTLGRLTTRLLRDLGDLTRNEVRLARAELSEKLSQAGSGITSFGLGAAVLFAGLLGLMQAAILALAQELDPWLASLVVGGAVALVGVGLLMRGRSKLAAEKLAPRRTAESVRRDAELAREHATSPGAPEHRSA